MTQQNILIIKVKVVVWKPIQRHSSYSFWVDLEKILNIKILAFVNWAFSSTTFNSSLQEIFCSLQEIQVGKSKRSLAAGDSKLALSDKFSPCSWFLWISHCRRSSRRFETLWKLFWRLPLSTFQHLARSVTSLVLLAFIRNVKREKVHFEVLKLVMFNTEEKFKTRRMISHRY